jgi:hypothetical protein
VKVPIGDVVAPRALEHLESLEPHASHVRVVPGSPTNAICFPDVVWTFDHILCEKR